MQKATSADGTAIAYERLGDGPPVILVGGATCDRAMMRPLAEQLARDYQVINYDRRGRGDSGDTAPYAVEREVEDLAALLTEAGGAAALYGHSSGAGLVLHAAAQGLPVTKLVLHEPPYNPDEDEQTRASNEYAAELDALLAEDRRDDALALFMTTVGMPGDVVEGMRGEPWWGGVAAIAHTLAYDSAVMGDREGGTVPNAAAARVTAPTLVLAGGESPDWMIEVGRRLAECLPNGRHRVLEGQEHVVEPAVLAPVLVAFLDG